MSAKQARRRAVANGKSDLADQYRERFQELYRQELQRARLERGPIRQGRPPGARDQLAIRSASVARTWRPPANPEGPSATPSDGGQHRRHGSDPRERVAALFEEGHSVSSVAQQLGVDVETAGSWWVRWRRERGRAVRRRALGGLGRSAARRRPQTAVSWRARWRAGGAAGLEYRRGRGPAIPDRQLPLIEQALLQGPAAHGFDGEVWSAPQVAEVIERLTGVRLTPSPVKRLLRERLGWTVQHPQVPARAPDASDQPGTSLSSRARGATA